MRSLKQLFDDHPSLATYVLLNDQENISTVDDLLRYYESGRYRPSESSEDLLLMTSLMIILNTQRAARGGQGKNVAQLPIFGKVVRDLKNYCSRVHHFDKDFLTVGFLFCKEIMPYVDLELMRALVSRTN
jgi:hypothetical protein